MSCSYRWPTGRAGPARRHVGPCQASPASCLGGPPCLSGRAAAGFVPGHRPMARPVGRRACRAVSVSVSVHALTAKVVDLDGSMAQFAAPVTVHEVLAATAPGAPSSSRFLCCSDALDFDAPITALAAHDALRPGQLYFALPMSTLGQPLSAQDMATLAVRACAALGTAPVVVAADVGRAGSAPSSSSSLDRSEGAAGAASNKQQRWQSTGRVAPVVVVVSAGADAHGEWKSYPVRGAYKDARKAARGGAETVGKARNGVGYKGVARDLSSVQRLSVIVEGVSE